jgi:hypothetical protein
MSQSSQHRNDVQSVDRWLNPTDDSGFGLNKSEEILYILLQ